MKFYACEFHTLEELQKVSELSKTFSDFDFCSICNINRDHLPRTIEAVVEVKSKFHPDGQNTCMSSCSHRTCGNYTTVTYEVLEIVEVNYE